MIKGIGILLLSFFYIASHAQGKEIMYVGTYSVRGSEGVYVYEFDRSKRTLTHIQTVRTLESPTFLAIHPSGKFLYTVNRGPIEGKNKYGSLSAYAIDNNTGKLSLLNHRSSYGSSPCHISVDRSGTMAFVSHFIEGTLVAFHISENGMLDEPTDSIRFAGKSIVSGRQDSPHIHSATPSPDNRYLFVADLGTDKIYSFNIDTHQKKLLPSKQQAISVAPGTGPRHFTFHPNNRFAYLAEEITSSICAFRYKKGKLTIIEDKIPSGSTK